MLDGFKRPITLNKRAGCDTMPILLTIDNSLVAIEKSISSIKEIDKNQHANLGIKFQQILQETNLIIEEIIYLQIFLELNVCFDKYKNIIIKLNSLNTSNLIGIKKDTFLFSSGIKCFSFITDSLVNCISQENERPQGNLKAMFLDTTYYELRVSDDSLTKYIEKDYAIETLSYHEMMQSQANPNILFVDLYPNYVTYENKICKTNIPELISKFLDNHDPLPLIVVMDTATTLFFDDEIETIIEKIIPFIENKKLIFIVTSSLSKFFSCGIHKYTGGIVQIYNNEQSAEWQHLYNFLEEKQVQDRLSDEALNFFNVLTTNCLENIKSYLFKIRKNTDYIYHALENSLKAGNGIELKEKDENVPMIGLSLEKWFKNFHDSPADNYLVKFTELMQYYIYAQAANGNLPMHIRSSFAFAHSSISECSTALRLTIGLEDREILDHYIAIIVKADQSILDFLLEKNSALLQGILDCEQDLSKPIIVKSAAGFSFKDFLQNLLIEYENLAIDPISIGGI